MSDKPDVLAATSAEPTCAEDAYEEVKRLQRVIHILIAADFVKPAKVGQAYEIAKWE